MLSFNGERVRSLAGLSEALSAHDGPFLRFELDNGETVVLDAAEARTVAGYMLHLYMSRRRLCSLRFSFCSSRPFGASRDLF